MVSNHLPGSAIIGNSIPAKEMVFFARQIAAKQHTVLLHGETGAGKDHLAEFIHRQDGRTGSFVPVDCGAINENLSENELFGHTGGAFTDARESKVGLIQIADDGTLFLNEVANMSMGIQKKLLRVLERRSYRQVGGTKENLINARIIAATNANLEEAVRRGTLRLDLYHRLNGISYVVPPLRERLDDIPALVAYFLEQESYSDKHCSPETMAVLMTYDWPGNVRELKNTITRAAFFSAGNPTIEPKFVRPYLTGIGDQGFPTIHEHERRYLRELLTRTKGNVGRAARIAGITWPTMRTKINRFGLAEFVIKLRQAAKSNQKANTEL